jgi:general secretion pathway protein G
MVALLALTVLLLVVLHRREENAAAVRATRATLTTVGWAISSYRADHGSACPRAMSDLVVGAYVREDPVDAWGRPLRLVCPGRRDPLGFDLSSDGPDGLPGGLDRLE